MTIPYGGSRQFPEPPEMFKCSIFLVLMNRLVTVCISALGMFLTADSFETSTPINLYASIAFSNLARGRWRRRGGGEGHIQYHSIHSIPRRVRTVFFRLSNSSSK